MDKDSLSHLVDRIGLLKFRYLGAFSAGKIPTHIPNGKFVIANTARSGKDGHWITLARHNGVLFYGDSYGSSLEKYPNLSHIDAQPMIYQPQQTNPNICGLYAIYYAWRLFSGFPVHRRFNDYDVIAFVCKYL